MKYFFKALLLFCVFAITSCNNSNAESFDDSYQEPTLSGEALLLDLMVSHNPQTSGLSRQEVLEDLDYLITYLHAYFPFLGVLYRDRGIDIEQLAIRTYNEIQGHFARHEYWDISSLFYFFRESFWRPMEGLGHFSMGNEPLDNTYLRPSENPGGANAAVSVQSIEKDHIGMIRIPSFMPQHQISQRGLLEEVSHYNHLIIDIRGNGGGFSSPFTRALILPLLEEDMYLEILAFTTTMEHRYYRPRLYYGSLHWTIDQAQTIHFTPIDQFLDEIALDPAMIHDIELFEYGARAVYQFRAHRARNPETNQMEISPVFSGKVWLVIDDMNFSAATRFARFMRDLDLATLVGRTQGGSNGGHRMNFQLPNTGFWIHYDAINLSDRYGRSWEEYRIEPHIFHHDPINHILYLIETGNY